MKKLTLPEQRKLYKSFKASRLKSANLLISFIKTGTYSRSHNFEVEMISDAKAEILKFVSIFEPILIKEAEEELKNIG